MGCVACVVRASGGIGCIGAWGYREYYMRSNDMGMTKRACRSWHGVETVAGVGTWACHGVESGSGKGKFRAMEVDGWGGLWALLNTSHILQHFWELFHMAVTSL